MIYLNNGVYSGRRMRTNGNRENERAQIQRPRAVSRRKFINKFWTKREVENSRASSISSVWDRELRCISFWANGKKCVRHQRGKHVHIIPKFKRISTWSNLKNQVKKINRSNGQCIHFSYCFTIWKKKKKNEKWKSRKWHFFQKKKKNGDKVTFVPASLKCVVRPIL